MRSGLVILSLYYHSGFRRNFIRRLMINEDDILKIISKIIQMNDDDKVGNTNDNISNDER